MDEMAAVLGIGVCLFAFLLVLLGIGSAAGGDWALIAEGVATFFAIIVMFCFGAFVLVKLMERR